MRGRVDGVRDGIFQELATVDGEVQKGCVREWCNLGMLSDCEGRQEEYMM